MRALLAKLCISLTSTIAQAQLAQLRQVPNREIFAGESFIIVDDRGIEGQWTWELLGGEGYLEISSRNQLLNRRHAYLTYYELHKGASPRVRVIYKRDGGYADTNFFTPKLSKKKPPEKRWIQMKQSPYPFCSSPFFGGLGSIGPESQPHQTVVEYFIDTMPPWVDHVGKFGNYATFRTNVPEDALSEQYDFRIYALVKEYDGFEQIVETVPVISAQTCKMYPEWQTTQYPHVVHPKETGTLRVHNGKSIRWQVIHKPEWITVNTRDSAKLVFTNTFDAAKKYEELHKIREHEIKDHGASFFYSEVPELLVEAEFIDPQNLIRRERFRGHFSLEPRTITEAPYAVSPQWPTLHPCGVEAIISATPQEGASYSWQLEGLPPTIKATAMNTMLLRLQSARGCDTSAIIKAKAVAHFADGRRDTETIGYIKFFEPDGTEGLDNDTGLTISIRPKEGGAWSTDANYIYEPVATHVNQVLVLESPSDLTLALYTIESKKLVQVDLVSQLPGAYDIMLNVTPLSEGGYYLRRVNNGQIVDTIFYVER
jgi:hypothetical protein